MSGPLEQPGREADEAGFARRAEEFWRVEYQAIARRTDRLFAALLGVEWVASVMVALVVTPRSWSGASSRPHPHLIAAITLGGVIATLPAALSALRPGAALTRHVVATAQMLMGALLIHVTGGRTETHFHVFGSLAFLAFYRDYRVLLTASAVVIADHVLGGLAAPASVYGVSGIDPLRWVEHAFWVAFEDVFLVASCIRGQREMRTIAERHTSLLELQKDFERGYEQAREASRAKSEFLANMSHEIRTPMTAVIGYADLLLDPETTQSDRLTYVQTIRRNGEHLLGVLNDILDLSKIEAGKMSVEHVRCSPSQIIVDVSSLMRVRAKEKNLFFEVRYLSPIPESIESDPTRLRQILMNLVGNAIKFTHSGGIRLLARCDTSGSAPTLCIDVVDTGIGLSPEQAGRLFQPFMQGDTSTTRKFGGTGLGLVICQRFAHMLGGSIDLESSIGRGSSFKLTVLTGSLDQVRMFEDLTEAGIPETGVPLGSGEPAQVQLSCSVLLVEDGLDNQLLISTLLSKAGAEVVIAENGRIAVEKALVRATALEPFDVILMDMQMPELDGYGATAQLRTKGYRGPIVALTAHAMAGDRERCLSAGCTDYLTKPIGRLKLLSTVAHHAAGRPRPFAPSGDEALGPRATPRPSSRPLRSEFAADPDMAEIVARFAAGLPAQMAELEGALSGGDMETVARCAHRLKGAAGGFGFGSITEAAAAVEAAIRSRSEPLGVRARAEDLLLLCRRVRVSTRMPAASVSQETLES